MEEVDAAAEDRRPEIAPETELEHLSALLAASSPPEWALTAVGRGATTVSSGDGPIRVRSGGRFGLHSATVPAAAKLEARELEELVKEAYLRLLESAGSARHLVRVWNHIPGILEPLGALRHRYLAFNAGRFHAYREWYGDDFPEHAPTASGVGASGHDLQIHALTSTEACEPLENPRQRPSHRYSESYGRCPPCFARGVLISRRGVRDWLVAGGTASVRGEETVHAGDLEAQTGETLLNLASLVDVAHGHATEGGASRTADLERGLSDYRSLRVYYVDEGTRGEVASSIDSRFPELEQVEYVRTELCRDDLLIEIEGVAVLG